MGAVLVKAAAFVAIIAMGYGLKKTGFFSAHDFYFLSKVVIRITLPCAIISNFSKISMDVSLLVMCVIGFACNVLLVTVGYLINLGKPGENKAFDMINMSGYNIGNFTMPFVQSFLGPVGFAVTSLFDAGNAIMCTGVSYTAASAVAGIDKKPSFILMIKKLFSSMPFDAYIIMTILAIFEIRLPGVVLSFAETVGGSNAFLALLMIGIGFEIWLDGEKIKRIAKVLVIRYGIALVLSIGFYKLAPFSLEIRQTLAIIMLGPISSVAPAFSGQLGGDVEVSSAINSLSIMLSIITITAALILIL